MTIKPQNVEQYLASGCGRCELGGTPDCKVQPWVEELRLLRAILLESDLTEEIKWSVPCYTYEGKNVLLLSALKDKVVVSFLQGAQLDDPENILEKPGEHSRFDRYMRFTDRQTIVERKATLLSYVAQAIEIKKSGKEPNVDSSLPEYPEELIQIFATKPDFEQAFSALTPGRQRGYLIHFSSAKQSKTKVARIERCMPKIFAGKGWGEY